MVLAVAKIALNHVTILWQTTNTKCLYIGIPEKNYVFVKIDFTTLLVLENRKNVEKEIARENMNHDSKFC